MCDLQAVAGGDPRSDAVLRRLLASAGRVHYRHRIDGPALGCDRGRARLFAVARHAPTFSFPGHNRTLVIAANQVRRSEFLLLDAAGRPFTFQSAGHRRRRRRICLPGMGVVAVQERAGGVTARLVGRDDLMGDDHKYIRTRLRHNRPGAGHRAGCELNRLAQRQGSVGIPALAPVAVCGPMAYPIVR